MDTRKVTFFATIAAIVLVAVGIGYAYTAVTSNTGNTVGEEYITLTQDSTGAYQFAPTGTNIYWDSNGKRVGDAPSYTYQTVFTLTPTAIVDNAGSKGIPGHIVVQLGNSFEVKAIKTNGDNLDSVKCQINATNFTKSTVPGMEIFLKVTGATGSAQYFKLMSDNTFVLMNETVTAAAGDNQFTIDRASFAENVETFNTATVALFAGYVGTNPATAGVTVERATPSAPVVGPEKNILNSAELKFAIHVAGANNPGATKVTTISLNESTVSKVVGQTETLIATIDGTVKTVTWSSTNGDVASVSSLGVVTAVAPGVAIITAATTEGNIIATCVVTVTAA